MMTNLLYPKTISTLIGYHQTEVYHLQEETMKTDKENCIQLYLTLSWTKESEKEKIGTLEQNRGDDFRSGFLRRYTQLD